MDAIGPITNALDFASPGSASSGGGGTLGSSRASMPGEGGAAGWRPKRAWAPNAVSRAGVPGKTVCLPWRLCCVVGLPALEKVAICGRVACPGGGGHGMCWFACPGGGYGMCWFACPGGYMWLACLPWRRCYGMGWFACPWGRWLIYILTN